MTTCGRQNWSCNIKDAVTILNKREPIIVGDWGLGTQLLFYTKGKAEINELAFDANILNSQDLAPVVTFYEDECSDFIFFAPEYTNFKHSREVLIPFLQNNSNYKKIQIYNRENKPFIEVYKCKE